jgi:hypothetical protein
MVVRFTVVSWCVRRGDEDYLKSSSLNMRAFFFRCHRNVGGDGEDGGGGAGGDRNSNWML